MRAARRRAALPIHTARARSTALHFAALFAPRANRVQHVAQYCAALLSV